MLPRYVKLAKFRLYSRAPSPFTELSKCFFKNLSLHFFEDSALLKNILLLETLVSGSDLPSLVYGGIA